MNSIRRDCLLIVYISGGFPLCAETSLEELNKCLAFLKEEYPNFFNQVSNMSEDQKKNKFNDLCRALYSAKNKAENIMNCTDTDTQVEMMKQYRKEFPFIFKDLYFHNDKASFLDISDRLFWMCRNTQNL